jgi:hypothetical protein
MDTFLTNFDHTVSESMYDDDMVGEMFQLQPSAGIRMELSLKELDTPTDFSPPRIQGAGRDFSCVSCQCFNHIEPVDNLLLERVGVQSVSRKNA